MRMERRRPRAANNRGDLACLEQEKAGVTQARFQLDSFQMAIEPKEYREETSWPHLPSFACTPTTPC